jgi:acetyl esterase
MTAGARSLGTPPGAVVLDPEITAVLAAMGDSPHLDLDALPIEKALALVRTAPASPPPPSPADRRIDLAPGRTMRVRFYFPDAARSELPILVHLHGGGFVGGSVEMDDGRCRRLARDADCIVVSLDYPLAPEHPFPSAIEDGFAAWQWILRSAREFGGDASRCAVSGSSAGGHLAVGICLLARDRGATPPVLQLLTYPVLDPALASASYRQFAGGPFLTQARMRWYWKQYSGTAGHDGQLWSPLSGSLAGLPPAHVLTAEFDVLRDEGETYAERLRADGVNASARRCSGMVHGFVSVVPDHRETSAALADSAVALRAAFSRTPMRHG